MKNVLLISEKIEEIDRLRLFFDDDCKITASGSIEAAFPFASDTALIIVSGINDFKKLMKFYAGARKSENGRETPVLIVLDNREAFKLKENLLPDANTAIINAAISDENLSEMVRLILMRQ